MAKTTLSIELSNELFAGLGRRKYDSKYVSVPVRAYGPEVLEVMTAFYKLVNLELTDETASIGVIASEQGFPQRVVGPKVYQKEGVLGVKIGSELYSFETTVTEDGEAKLSLNGKAATILSESNKPVFKLAVGNGNFIKLPVYINYSEEAQSYYGFTELEAALTDPTAIAKIVGEPKVKGESTGGIIFGDLKAMPAGRYQIVSAKNSTGKYGATLDILLKTTEDITMQTFTKGENGWGLSESLVPAGSTVKVGGNTALKSSLMGTELSAADNVYLDITGAKQNKEGKTIVICDLDYSESRLAFEF